MDGTLNLHDSDLNFDHIYRQRNLDIIVHHGSIIDALTVGDLKIGGDGGRQSEIVFSVSETITGIEFGRSKLWAPGICALKGVRHI